MEMIYHAGIGGRFVFPEKINLAEKKIISYEVKMLKDWKSPNLVIKFDGHTFEQPVPLIVNYNAVIKYLKKIV
jgi:hypothetical protein